MAVKASATITLSAVVDVDYTTRYYLLQSSTSPAPSAPSTNPPTGSWSDTEPTYTSGSTNSLYFCDLTVFSDSTWAYSSVSLSSSYEAAKEAYNQAVAAAGAADAAQDAADNAQAAANSAIASISITDGNISALAGDLSTLSTTVDMNSEGLTAAVTRIGTAESDITAINSELTAQQNWLRFDTNGLTMGETGSPFSVNLTTQQLTFVDNGVDVAYINGQKYFITDGEITNSLTLGKFKFVPQTNDNLSLIYIG